MSWFRAPRKSICRVLIGILLFAQFAVASYACPRLSDTASIANGYPATLTAVAVDSQGAVSVSTAGILSDCDRMDQDAGNLCAEHCRQGQQSVDSAPAPVMQAAMPTLLYPLFLEPEHTPGFGRSFPAHDARMAAAHAPPHAILHCVFRI